MARAKVRKAVDGRQLDRSLRRLQADEWRRDENPIGFRYVHVDSLGRGKIVSGVWVHVAILGWLFALVAGLIVGKLVP